MIKIGFLFVLAMVPLLGFAQKQIFGPVNFSAPKGWQQQQNEGGMQLSVTDQQTGAYALAIITKATTATAAANENFNSDWNRLVKGTVQVNSEPAMLAPVKQDNWDILSGSANYTDGANNGAATLLTATGGGQMVSVVVMTNTQQYQKDLLAFINSLKLTKTTPVATTSTGTTNTTGGTSILGLWVYYTIEANSYYNGLPVSSGGYFRKEYVFNANGTYVYRLKNWSVLLKDILFVYESGTWAVSGNKLTITPKLGKGGWWNKAGQRTSEWGSLDKKSEWTPETVTYTFDFHYYSGTNETDLVLTSGKQTEREGKQDNNSIMYSPRALDKSLIDNPPGFKPGL